MRLQHPVLQQRLRVLSLECLGVEERLPFRYCVIIKSIHLIDYISNVASELVPLQGAL